MYSVFTFFFHFKILLEAKRPKRVSPCWETKGDIEKTVHGICRRDKRVKKVNMFEEFKQEAECEFRLVLQNELKRNKSRRFFSIIRIRVSTKLLNINPFYNQVESKLNLAKQILYHRNNWSWLATDIHSEMECRKAKCVTYGDNILNDYTPELRTTKEVQVFKIKWHNLFIAYFQIIIILETI